MNSPVMDGFLLQSVEHRLQYALWAGVGSVSIAMDTESAHYGNGRDGGKITF